MSKDQSLQPLDSTGRWIVHNAPKVDLAWDFQQIIEKRRPPPSSLNLENRKTRFNKFMSQYFSRCKDKEAHRIFQTANTWEAVRKEAELALDNYENRGKSWRNPLRRSMRLVGGVSSRLEFLTVLIPSGDYLGVLCGGLTLIYNAANRQRELTALIVESLGTLTEEMNHAQSYILDYAWNPELLRAADDLYIAILDAIEAIVEWIAKSQGLREVWETGKAFFQQGEYGKELEDKISTNVKTKVEAFDRIVEKCLRREVRDIAQNVYQAGQILDIVDGKIDENTSQLQKVHAALYTVEDVIRGIAKDFDTDRTKLAERQRLFEEHQKEIQAINEQRFNQLQQYEYALACSAAAIQGQLQQQPRQTIHISQLLAALNLTELNPSLDSTDQVVDAIGRERELILFFGRTLDSPLQNKISTVMQNPEFVSWLKGLDSRALIISGMDMNALQGEEVVSPLTYMCAALARTVAETRYAHPIAFFCRLHSDPGDRLRGAAGMMRSLIAQLALFCIETTPDLLSFLAPTDLNTIKAGTLSDLCRLFDNLVQSVGSGVIICMIDGVNFFENEMCLREMHDAMRFLNNLLEAVNAAQCGLVLKLLVTSPTASENCRYWFPNRVDLFMPREFLLDGQGFDGLGMPMF